MHAHGDEVVASALFLRATLASGAVCEGMVTASRQPEVGVPITFGGRRTFATRDEYGAVMKRALRNNGVRFSFTMLALTGCVTVRQVDDADEGGGGASVEAPPTDAPLCETGEPPMVHERFDVTESWPAAWMPVDLGQSWIEDGDGYMAALPGAHHKRLLEVTFVDIDMRVRFALGATEPQGIVASAFDGRYVESPLTLSIARTFGEPSRRTEDTLDAVLSYGPNVVASLSPATLPAPPAFGQDVPLWLRMRLLSRDGGRTVGVKVWRDGDREPAWTETFLEDAPEVGGISVGVAPGLAAESSAPLRIEEIVVCQPPFR